MRSAPIWVFLMCWVAACSNPHPTTTTTLPNGFDIQGHRGARGQYPENTIEGMISALQMGATTLEMDVVVTADSQVVVSHEPWISAEICLDPNGDTLPDDPERFNIYQMTYEEVKAFDCGLKPHPRFPNQEKVPATKPLLIDLLQSVEHYVDANDLSPVNYNIEIKSHPGGDGIFHPAPALFTAMVLRVIDGENLLNRVTIQSFDPRSLEYAKLYAPNLSIALLVESEQPLKDYEKMLSFTPAIFSPNHELVDSKMVEWAHKRGMQIIPWTVNTPAAIEKMIQLGVDGIISDYPDRVAQYKKQTDT